MDRLTTIWIVVGGIIGLIVLGWLAGRLGVVNQRVAKLVNTLTASYGLPVLIFNALTQNDRTSDQAAAFIAVYGATMIVTFVLAMVLARLSSQADLKRMSVHGLAASFGNTGVVGVPVGFAMFGNSGGEAGALGTVLGLTVAVTGSVILIELSQIEQRSWRNTAFKSLRTVGKNGVILAAAGSVIVRICDLTPLPSYVREPVNWVSAATPMAGVFGLGLFLATLRRPQFGRETTGLLIAKVLVQPAVATLLVALFGGIGTPWGQSAILMALLPTGISAFLIAHSYNTFVEGVSSAILASTGISVVTMSLLVVILE